MAGQNHDLQAAQTRLEAVRRARRVVRSDQVYPVRAGDHGRFPPNSTNYPVADLNRLPEHLGWGSARLTAVLRRTHREKPAKLTWLSEITPVQELTPHAPAPQEKYVKVYPDLALAMLRNQLAAPGRIWLLLRHLDSAGQGWLLTKDARTHLTTNSSPWRVCGWRQLRNLFRQGEGVFWQRRDGRLWLKSVAKTAAALGVFHLAGRPVALKPHLLTQKIGAVRAHFYASFHSGRKEAPIARDTLGRLCGISAHTQRSYEDKSKVQRRVNYAVGAQTSSGHVKELCWQRGYAVFPLIDKKGCQGKPGITYLAWQLPNSYRGPHTVLPRGRQKRINRELADLFTQGMTGNGRDSVDTPLQTRRYYKNGRAAVSARNSCQDAYWQSPERRGVWFCADSLR